VEPARRSVAVPPAAGAPRVAGGGSRAARCWGSPPRVPEVALDCRKEAEGTEGRQSPEATFQAKGK